MNIELSWMFSYFIGSTLIPSKEKLLVVVQSSNVVVVVVLLLPLLCCFCPFCLCERMSAILHLKRNDLLQREIRCWSFSQQKCVDNKTKCSKSNVKILWVVCASRCLIAFTHTYKDISTLSVEARKRDEEEEPSQDTRMIIIFTVIIITTNTKTVIYWQLQHHFF